MTFRDQYLCVICRFAMNTYIHVYVILCYSSDLQVQNEIREETFIPQYVHTYVRCNMLSVAEGSKVLVVAEVAIMQAADAE